MINSIEGWGKIFLWTLVVGSMINMSSPIQVQSAGGIEWVSINSNLPTDIPIDKLAYDPNNETTIYAAGPRGVYKSIDGGNNWQVLATTKDLFSTFGTPTAFSTVGDLVVDPSNSNNVYLGYKNGQIFKSTNKGQDWQKITNNLPTFQWESNLKIVLSPNAIYVGNYNGVYKTTDGGQSWIKISKNPIPDNYSYYALAINSSGKIYVSMYDGIYTSINGGDTWTKVSEQHSLNELVITPSNPTVIYAKRWDGIYKSTDSGANWAPKNNGLPQYHYPSTILVDPTDANTVYIWTSKPWDNPPINALYKTTDGGENWVKVDSLNTKVSASSLVMAKTSKHLYAAGRGIFKSIDQGSSWQEITTGLPNYVEAYSIVPAPKAPGRLYALTRCGVFKSTDYGTTWSVSYATYTYRWLKALVVDPNNPDILYLGGYSQLYKTSGTDTGRWNPIISGLPQNFNIASIAIDPNNSQVVYACGWRSVYKSLNGGDTWSTINLNMDLSFHRLMIDPVNPDIIYGLPQWEGGLYRSEDLGENWISLQIPDNLNINTLAFGPSVTIGTKTVSTIYACGNLRFYQSVEDRILKSTDAGASWTKISDEAVNSLIVHPDKPFLLYASNIEGIIKSIDEGKSWAEVNTGLPEEAFMDDQDKELVGTGTGSLVIDPNNPKIFYLVWSGYGIFRGTDTNNPPLPPIIQHPSDGAKISDTTPLIIGKAQPGTVISIYETTTFLGTTSVDSSSVFNFTPSNPLNPGFHNLRFIAADIFGLSSPTNLSFEIVAGIAPTINQPLPGPTNQSTLTITGLAVAGGTVVIYDGQTPLGTVTVSENGFYTYQTTPLKDGFHKLYVISTSQDEIISASAIVEVLIDTVAPPAPYLYLPHEGPTNNNKPKIEGVAISNSLVILYANGIQIGTTTSDNIGKFGYKVVSPLSQGKHSLTACVVDSVGNISPHSWQREIDVDFKPVILYPRSGRTNDNKPTIIGNAPPDSTVEIVIDQVTIGTTTADVNGSFSFILQNTLNDGTHTIKAMFSEYPSDEIRLVVETQLPFNPINVSVKQPWRKEKNLSEDNKVQGIRNQPMNITIPVKDNVATVTIKIKSTGAIVTLTKSADGNFIGQFTPTSSTDVEITMTDQSGSSTTLPLMKIELIDPAGFVYDAVTYDKIIGATVTCYYWDEGTTTSRWVVWDAPKYGQINPQVTPFSSEFDYSFLVPKGTYYVYATAQGYKPYQSPELKVIDIPVFHDIYMEPIPVLTSIKVFPQSVVIGLGGTYSFTAMGYDQYERMMEPVKCNWTTTIGTVSPNTGANTIFTAPNGIGSGVITAATGSVKSGTATVTIRELTTVKLSPSTVYIRKNGTFTLDIVIENVVDLLGAKVVLSFDSNKIKAGMVSAGNFFSENATMQLLPRVDNNQGIVEIGGARFGTSGVTGTGTLYSVSFTSITADSSGTISITEVVLKDVNLSIISAGGKYPAVIRGRLLSDFGRKSNQITEEIPDGKIDFEDLVLFASYWNTQNLNGDIASTRTTGTAPNFIHEPDGKVNFEDLVYFAAIWNWYHSRLRIADCGLRIEKPTTPLTAIVKLKMVEISEDKICVDVVVENVLDFSCGQFKLRFDTNKLELGTITSPILLFRGEEEKGKIDINITDLHSEFRKGGSVVRITFKPLILNLSSIPIDFITVDLRDTQPAHIPANIVPLITFPTDLTKAYCYPNPYIHSKYSQQGITFADLTEDVRIKIFTIAGELVYDSGMITSVSPGTFKWHATNQSGNYVASGIYIYLITNNQGDKKTGKVGVVR